MSRFSVTNKTGMKFAYGYDTQTEQYFLDQTGTRQSPNEYLAIVGFGAQFYPVGRNGVMLSMLGCYGLTKLIPASHLEAITHDLPIPEDDRPVFVHNGEGQTRKSVEEEIDRHNDDRFNTMHD